MNVKNFVFAILGMFLALVAVLSFFSALEVPLIALLKAGLLEAGLAAALKNLTSATFDAGAADLALVVVMLLSNCLLCVFMYNFFNAAMASFTFLTAYYKKLYAFCLGALLIFIFLIPLVWALASINIFAVAGVSMVLLSGGFTLISILLKDVLRLTNQEPDPEEAELLAPTKGN